MHNDHPLRGVYKIVDGHEIDVDIYLPSFKTNGEENRCPVIIDIHGGAFMLGSSRMVNKDQIDDCLSRNWIVLAPNHRLCPQVNVLEGPMQDCRDLLAWIYRNKLEEFIQTQTNSPYTVNLDYVFAFGTSSGGTLALSLGFGVPRPVAGIFDMYGACNFADHFWTKELPAIADKLPSGISEEFINQVFDEHPVPTTAGVSLEGQQPGPPDFSDPRQAYAFKQIATGKVMNAIFPSREWVQVDPIENITAEFPPTFIVHGIEDEMVPLSLSKDLFSKLSQHGVKCGLREIPNEGHTFAARMKKGSQTWNLQREGFNFLESLIQ